MNADIRLGRQGFWIGSILVWAVFFGGRPWLGKSTSLSLLWAALTLCVLLLLMRARLLDRGRGSWWLTVLAVPVLGAAWLFWELACRGPKDAGVPRR